MYGSARVCAREDRHPISHTMESPLGPVSHGARPFVGRRHESARLDAALADALAGRGRVVMLVGDPGIGKTRTAEHLAAAAREREAQVLFGRCHEGDGAPAYWPWRQIVRAYIRDMPAASLAEDLDRGAAEVSRVVEDLRRIFPSLPALSPSVEPDEARFRLFDAFTRFLCAVARRRPLVLVLDDLHWADLASLHLLQFLAREIGESPILIVGAYREAEAREEEAKAEVLGSLTRERLYERLALRGLSEDDARALLTALVGSTLSDDVLRVLHERTAGNPFFLTEVARRIDEQPLPAGTYPPSGWIEGLPIPESLHAMVRQRVKHLRPPTLELLKVAAVVGGDLELAAVAAVLDTDRESILPLVVEAAQAGILQAPETTSPGVRFHHALVRDILYDALPADERARLHRRAGLGLERHWQLELDEHAAALAVHALASVAAGDVHRAVGYAVRAAQRAMAQVAYDEAIQWYRRALAALAQEPSADPARNCRLLLALGAAQAAASNVHEMRETFRRAADLARHLGDAEALVEAAIGFARVPVMEGSLDAATVDLLDEALGMLPESDSALRAEGLSMLAYSLQHAPGLHDRRGALCREAAGIAYRIGDLRTLARTLYDHHRTLLAPGTLDDRIAAAGELLRLAQQTDDRAMLLRARFCRVIDWLEMGRLAQCDAEIEALDQLAGELREPWQHWYAAWFRATRAMMSGHFDAGEQFAQQAFSHGERVAPEVALQVLGAQISMLRALQGRWAEMTPAIRDLVEQFPAIAAWRCALAYHCCELGETDEARRHLEILARDDFASIPRDSSWFVSISQLADVCSSLDDAERAAVLYDQLAPFADRLMIVSSALGCSGLGARYLGLLAMTMKRWGAAESHLLAAVDAHRRLGMLPWVALTLYDYARMLVERDTPIVSEAARRALAEAGELAGGLGMAGLATKVAALGAGSGGSRGAVEVAPSHAVATYVFLKEGEFWTVAYEGCVARLKDALGLQYLVHLLRHPGRPFHVTELLALAGGSRTETKAPEGLSVRVGSDALPALDERARSAYRARLLELEEDLAEAEHNHDIGAAERARTERDALAQQFSSSARGSTAGERARSSITKRLKAALAKIRAANPELARHLMATVRTGYFCRYVPDPRHPIDWQT